MKYIVVILISFYMVSCANNSPAKTNVEDSTTINSVKEEAGSHASSNTDSIPGVSNGASTVSGNTGSASPGSGISLPTKSDSTKSKSDSSNQ